MKIQDFVKNILPPFVFNLVKKCFVDRKYGWHGDYPSWEAAQAHCKGYDSDEIINKVRDSLLKVKNGEAVYERDSVIFEEIQYSWPVLSGLMWVAAKNNGKLNVLDFGGSLGSSYFQNKAFLDKLSDVKWNIIEQEKFVKIGKKDFENKTLRFYSSIEECIDKVQPNVVLLSSVIQYIENPYKLLDRLFKLQIDTIIIDLTGFTHLDDDIITIQRVNPTIYKASYPCRIFSHKKLNQFFNKNGYDSLVNFSSYIGNDLYADKQKFSYKGMVFYKETFRRTNEENN